MQKSINVTELTLRKIGNSQGVLIPKSILDYLHTPLSFEAEVVGVELRLRPKNQIEDPFGFRSAFLLHQERGEINEDWESMVFEEDYK